jgi:hypothetical protein
MVDLHSQGSFQQKPSKGRLYWHYQSRDGDRVLNKYVGPASDPDITSHIERLGAIKSGFKRRQTLVRGRLSPPAPSSRRRGRRASFACAACWSARSPSRALLARSARSWARTC